MKTTVVPIANSGSGSTTVGVLEFDPTPAATEMGTIDLGKRSAMAATLDGGVASATIDAAVPPPRSRVGSTADVPPLNPHGRQRCEAGAINHDGGSDEQISSGMALGLSRVWLSRCGDDEAGS